MYSMKRTMCPVPLKCRAISTTACSFTPRCTTAFTFTGPSPASAADSIPSSTAATGKPTSFIFWNVGSSSASRLTVTRSKPAEASDLAFLTSNEALVVSVRSSTPSTDFSMPTSFSRSFRKSGSPPVILTFLTPRSAKSSTNRTISSKLSNWSRGRNSWSLPNSSLGMQ